MKKEKLLDWSVPLLFLLLTIFLFRTYVFSRTLVPLPFNLLVSYYAPWKYEEDLGFGIGVANKPLGYDNIKLFYPFRKFTQDRLISGHIPLWNPYVFSGSVHHATFQSAVLYPLNLVYFFLPAADAWSILIIIELILAGWFTYLFLRSLALSRKASLVGSLGFAYSGWMIAYWQEVLVLSHSALWLPLAFFGSNCIWEGDRRRGFLYLLVGLSMSILAGFPQIAVYVLGVVGVWNLYRWKQSPSQDQKNRDAIRIVAAIGLSILLTAIQWLPAFEAYVSSPRANVDSAYIFQTFLSPLWYLVTFLIPDFWGNPGTYNYYAPFAYLQERTIAIGVGVFLLAILAFASKNKKLRFWKIFTILTLSLGFALPTSWIWYVLRTPILSAAQPERIFVLSTFGLCVLAAYGFDAVFVNYEMNWKVLQKVLLGIVVIFIMVFIWVGCAYVVKELLPLLFSRCAIHNTSWYCGEISNPQFGKNIASYVTVGLRNTVFSFVFFLAVSSGLWIFRRNSRAIFFILCFSTIIWAAYTSNKMLYFSERKNEYPLVTPIIKLKQLSGFDRVWSYGDAYSTRNILSYFGLYSPEGYEALYEHRYGKLLNTIVTNGVLTDKIQRTDATLSETGQYEIMTNNPYRLRLMSLLSVKYILEYKGNAREDVPASKRFPSDLFTISWEDDRWRIWEYKKSLPRAFFVTNYIALSDDQKIIDALYNPSIDLTKTVILEESPACCMDATEADATVSILKYEPETVELSVEAQSDGLVFLSDTYYPGWKATVDGKETKIYRANFSFRAIEVPKGAHRISFIYDPLSWKVGIAVSIGSLILFTGYFLRKNLIY